MAKARIGVLTGGGDTPALNPTLYGIVKAAEEEGVRVVGFMRGWAGPLFSGKEYLVGKGDAAKPLKDQAGGYIEELKSGMINPDEGGSILKSSRTNLTKIPGALEDVVERCSAMGLDGIIAVGGDDTTTVANVMAESTGAIKIMAVPKTIDNDNGKIGPEGVFTSFEEVVNIWTPGFPSAVQRAREYAGSSITTTYTHDRVMLDEAMGRKAGFLALAMGTVAGADAILVPEVEVDVEEFCARIAGVYREKGYAYVVVSEGARDAKRKNPDGSFQYIAEDPTVVDTFGHKKLGGAAKMLEEKVKEHFRKEGIHSPYINAQQPGYFFRGGAPTARDRDTAVMLGRHALESFIGGAQSGQMAVLMYDGRDVVARTMPIKDAVIVRDGRIVPRDLPVKGRGHEAGFYDPAAMNVTDLGRQYVDLLGVPPVNFSGGYRGEVRT